MAVEWYYMKYIPVPSFSTAHISTRIQIKTPKSKMFVVTYVLAIFISLVVVLFLLVFPVTQSRNTPETLLHNEQRFPASLCQVSPCAQPFRDKSSKSLQCPEVSAHALPEALSTCS